ncbi:MAG: hypothetical protein IJI60_01580 [Bacilli bacterium]|nr:hypothetical protein [Bacilli bacterium]
MVKSTVVKSDSEKLALYLTDYANRFEALQTDWKGMSYNKLKEKADAFAKNATDVVKMMEYLSTICEYYEMCTSAHKETSSSRESKMKSINKKATEIEELFYDIKDLENITVGATNFVGKRYLAPQKLIIQSKKEDTKEVFRLNTDITNSNFKTIKTNIDQLRTKVLSYETTVGITGFEVKIADMVKKIANNLQICSNRVQNTITVIEAVVDNHTRLQENLVKYIKGEDEEEETRDTTPIKMDSEKKEDEDKKSKPKAEKEASADKKTDKESATDKKETTETAEPEATVVEAAIQEEPVQAAGYGGYGGYQEQAQVAPVEETQPEVPVTTNTTPAATTPRVIKAQTKSSNSDATAMIPLAGIGLVGAAGGIALLAKKKKEEEEEAEYLEDEDLEELDLNSGKKIERSTSENKEWLHSLGLGINDEIDGSSIENDSISMGGNN